MRQRNALWAGVIGFWIGVLGTSATAETGQLPRASWDHQPQATQWTQAALAALEAHGQALTAMVPADIADWCPGFADGGEPRRRAFWVGFLSALAKHESTHRQSAVGGGGKWFGLVQISPATARGYGCAARSGQALKDGSANLSCAVRIMARTVPRDGVVSRGGRGVAADWGPLHSSRKKADMMAWTKQQSYCTAMEEIRPKARAKPQRPKSRGDG